MGGRGSSSGISVSGKRYGTQYRTVLKVSNIKFVTKNTRDAETLMETMTKGRVYATVGGDEITHITYFGSNNKRSKTIDLTHSHKRMKPHTHHGYYHNEIDSKKGASKLTTEEKKMVDFVLKTWYNKKRKR